MSDDPTNADLVARAQTGDKLAWDKIVERYAPLVWTTCRRYGLLDSEAHSVGQNVWLRLVKHLPVLSEPATLPRWLATTAAQECRQVAQASADPRERAADDADRDFVVTREPGTAGPGLLLEERDAALHAAFTALPPPCQELLSMLLRDTPSSGAEISAELGIPIDDIGPARARCLDRLRHHPAIIALMVADPELTDGDE